jgi:hypothetical protein
LLQCCGASGLHKQRAQLGLAFGGRDVERSGARSRTSIRRGAAGDEQTAHFEMAVLHGEVQRSMSRAPRRSVRDCVAPQGVMHAIEITPRGGSEQRVGSGGE